MSSHRKIGRSWRRIAKSKMIRTPQGALTRVPLPPDDVLLEADVDLEALITWAGAAAARNKKGVSRVAGGAIRVRVIERRPVQ